MEDLKVEEPLTDTVIEDVELDARAVEVEPMSEADIKVTQQLESQLEDLVNPQFKKLTEDEIKAKEDSAKKALALAMAKTVVSDLVKIITVRKIDTKTGLYLEDVEVSEDEKLTKEFVSEPIPEGLYLPKWNGKKWVEADVISSDNLKATVLKNSVNALCDEKSVEAKNYINGSFVSMEQLARYEEKYQSAFSYKTDASNEDILKLEAELKDLSVSDFADVVIAKGDAYKLALATFNSKIEAFRIQVNKLIAVKEFEKVEQVLKGAEALGADATDDDIKSLFAKD